jgi:uncharacterized protein
MPMKIVLEQLSKTPFVFSFESSPDLDEDDVRLTGNAKTEGELSKKTASVEVNGRIYCEVGAECARCAGEANLRLDFQFKAEFVPEGEFSNEHEHQVHGADLDISTYSDGEIDLEELTREQILLNLPTQILCKENCKGLCPTCGANRNLKTCDCREKEIDPRWAELKKLK